MYSTPPIFCFIYHVHVRNPVNRTRDCESALLNSSSQRKVTEEALFIVLFVYPSITYSTTPNPTQLLFTVLLPVPIALLIISSPLTAVISPLIHPFLLNIVVGKNFIYSIFFFFLHFYQALFFHQHCLIQTYFWKMCPTNSNNARVCIDTK